MISIGFKQLKRLILIIASKYEAIIQDILRNFCREWIDILETQNI